MISQQHNKSSNSFDKPKSAPLFFKPFIQPKLSINPPNDAFEQEADVMADRVMRMAADDRVQTKFFNPIHSVVQPKSAECQEKGTMQRKVATAGQEITDKGFTNYVDHLGSSGQSLSNEVCRFYEPRFNYDFSHVKIHTDTVAAKSAQSINALAYTSGNNIVFNHGQYAPNTESGKKLLGHELTHVVQAGESSATIKMHATNNNHIVRRLPQEPTLGEAKKTGATLPRKSLSTMDVDQLFKMPDPDRRAWYVDKLGAYENQLKESANNNLVPVQLLATVILNELADISWVDIAQSDLAVGKGSLGIAQIQIDTAIKDNLFSDLTEAEGKQAYREMVINTQPSAMGKLAARLMENADDDKRIGINKRLQIPQYAIEAAAREIRILLDQMIANRGKDWQTRYGFVHAGIKGPATAQAIYADVAGSNQLEKELNLSKLITGAYNSPGIIAAANSSESVFPNANIHGDNSKLIAGDLYVFGLYRP